MTAGADVGLESLVTGCHGLGDQRVPPGAVRLSVQLHRSLKMHHQLLL